MIRPAQIADIPAFAHIETEADRRYDETGLLADATNSDNIPQAAIREAILSGLACVVECAGGGIVGFCLCTIRAPDLYLDQISVLPEQGGQGLGRALMAAVRDLAHGHGLPSVSLSTFRHVPWNGPFYRRLGYTEIPRAELMPWMLELESMQAEYLDISQRCFMRLDLGPGPWT